MVFCNKHRAAVTEELKSAAASTATSEDAKTAEDSTAAKESAPPAGEASKPGAVVSEEAAEPSEGKKKTVATLVMAKLGEMWRALDEAGKKVMNQICLVHVVIVCCLTPNFC